MGKENEKGINVKPDKLVRISYFGGGQGSKRKGVKERGRGKFPEQFPKCKLELVILFEQPSRLLSHHRKVSNMN